VKRIKKKKHHQARTGDIAEHYAITWLWDNGYEVFLNPGATGPIDLVAYKDGECILIDVKTLCPDKRGNSWRNGGTRTARQKQMGVVFLGFHPKTRKLRWIKHRET
jgi:Holliday junction resolvase-like predicted endonuclease